MLKKLGMVMTLSMLVQLGYANITFENIKNRKIVSFELTDIILDLSLNDSIETLDRWRELSPSSFRRLNFTKSYIDASTRLLRLNETNKAIQGYIKAYQYIDKEYHLKIEAAFQVASLLYAQSKRSEALFYINRTIELLVKYDKKNTKHPRTKDIFSLQRRVVWRYFSRLDFLPDNAISTVEFDNDDIWIGMWSGGLGRFSRSQLQLDLFTPKNTALPSYYVRDILVRNDKIWIATHCGLGYYQKNNSSWHQVASMKNYKFKTISHDGEFFYAATLFNGVFRSKDGLAWDNIIPRHSILDILHTDQSLFIATPERGVFVYKDDKLQPFLSNISAKTIIEDNDGMTLWVGTYGQGLLKVNKKTGEIHERFGQKEMASTHIESLLLIDDQLWIGTLAAGLSIYNTKKKTWTRLGLSEGLPGLDITTITQENDHLWLGTLAGGIGIYLFR
ncbi:MAG: ligand-binding sensor domain-containing protein [Brevinema sp.]